MKYEFDLVIKSRDGAVTLKFNGAIGKWEALDSAGKVMTRRKNIAMLIHAINGVE